jgi:hypothetical protein
METWLASYGAHAAAGINAMLMNGKNVDFTFTEKRAPARRDNNFYFIKLFQAPPPALARC